MPVNWTFDSTRDVSILTITEPYTFNDWRLALDEILATHPGPVRLLVDRRGAEAATTNLVDEMIGYFRAHAARLSGSIGAVVVSGEAAYGMARMFEIRTEVSRVPITTKTFLDYGDAVRWLESIGANSET